MKDINYIGGDEFVFNSDNGEEIQSGGFSVNSIMMKAGMSPIMTLNSQHGGGDKVSDLFDSLVIPSWALSYGNIMNGGKYQDKKEDESDEEIDDDLHEKLIDLVKHHEAKLTREKKRKTRKQNINSKKGGTKKYK